MDAAQCIGCGACVAACPNGSASLFTAAKISHLGLLPQGQPERLDRARRMVAQMDVEGFGGCTLFGECQEACPKQISIDTITAMNRDFLRASCAPERAALAESGLTLARPALVVAAVLAPAAAAGQSPPWADVGAAGVVAYESSSVVPGGGSLGEIRVVQPTLMLHAGAGRHFRLMTTVNFEGATIPDGELALGNWGEGFVDRRHPHTWPMSSS